MWGFDIGITAPEGEVHLTSIVPTSDRVTVTAYEDDNGAAQPWAVTASAICAAESFGLQIVSSPSPANQFDATTCPAGRTAIGAGGNVDGTEDDVDLTSVKLPVSGGKKWPLPAPTRTGTAPSRHGMSQQPSSARPREFRFR